MTQEETAAQMNLSVNTIAKMEQQGREPGTKAGKIALNALQDRAIAEGKLVLKEGQLVKP
jgi:DNA-binding transcriptional regulator YiaG